MLSAEQTEKIWQEIYIDYYQHGYDNAAIRFAYIPDFPSDKAKQDWERGYKDGLSFNTNKTKEVSSND